MPVDPALFPVRTGLRASLPAALRESARLVSLPPHRRPDLFCDSVLGGFRGPAPGAVGCLLGVQQRHLG